MPLYNAVLLVPANTTQTAPISVIIEAPDQWIEHIEINFPLRCSNQVGVQINNGPAQIAPAPSALAGNSQWIRGDNFVVAWDENIDLGPAPHRIIIEAYNLDAIFDHTVDVRLVINPTSSRNLLAALAARGMTN